VPVTSINSADDFINPPGPGLAERNVEKLSAGTFIQTPKSIETRGRSTHAWAILRENALKTLVARSQ
jgi:homoserine O-acetyltransferase